MNKADLHRHLLTRIIRLQKINMALLTICGVLAMMSFLQSFFHPTPWIMAPYPVFFTLFLLVRRKVDKLRMAVEDLSRSPSMTGNIDA